MKEIINVVEIIYSTKYVYRLIAKCDRMNIYINGKISRNLYYHIQKYYIDIFMNKKVSDW